ncbi:MAG: SDR family oxidoreductase [Cyclobacteriaceae bacterium]|nr:SDR family oxidoreductase [Cyclobacteriaceae bacterium]
MKDKVVIITGGTSGIGKALAFEFGRHGSKVVITGRNATDLNEAGRELKAAGIEALEINADVSREEDNKKMAEETLGRFGRIDVLINNAGISMRAAFQDVKIDVIKKVMDINFYGAIYATHYCLPEIVKNKGSIVGISSIAGFRGLPGRTGYSASKFALNGFLEVLRTEYLRKGVHVLTACPGFTATNIRMRALLADGREQKESPREESKEMTPEKCARHIYKATVKRKQILILTLEGKLAVFFNKWWPWLADRLVFNAMAHEANAPVK